MDSMFIEAKYIWKLSIDKRMLDILPQKIGLVTTVQFAHRAGEIISLLKEKQVFMGKGRQKYKSQVLGCDVSAALKIKDNVDAFLYVGTGSFHPLGLAMKTEKEVCCYNPFTKEIYQIKKIDIENYKKMRKGALMRFLTSGHIGILVSTKPGQNNIKKAIKLKSRLKDKQSWIFMFDTLNISDLENFPFIQCWVNTACPRIEGKGIINIDEVFSALNG